MGLSDTREKPEFFLNEAESSVGVHLMKIKFGEIKSVAAWRTVGIFSYLGKDFR